MHSATVSGWRHTRKEKTPTREIKKKEGGIRHITTLLVRRNAGKTQSERVGLLTLILARVLEVWNVPALTAGARSRPGSSVRSPALPGRITKRNDEKKTEKAGSGRRMRRRRRMKRLSGSVRAWPAYHAECHNQRRQHRQSNNTENGRKKNETRRHQQENVVCACEGSPDWKRGGGGGKTEEKRRQVV